MDGQDYGFDIHEEFDIMEDIPSVNSTKTPAAQYKAADTEEQDTEIPADVDAGDIDLLADPAETTDKKEGGSEGEEEKVEGDEQEGDVEEEEIVEDDSVFQKIADNLTTMGLLIPDEGEDKVVITKPEELAERFQKSYQTQANAYIQHTVGELGPEYADAWDKIFVKGLNPFDYFTHQAKIDSIESLDIENEDDQKQIVRTYLQKQGLPADRIEVKIQQAVDLDDLANDAKAYQGLLVQAAEQDKAKAAAQAETTRKQEEAQHTNYASAVHGILTEKLKDKEFDGIPLTPKAVERAVDFIYTYKYKGPDGKLLTEADVWYLELKNNPVLAAKMALLAPTGFDVAKIQKKGQSQTKGELFNDLIQTQKVVKRTTPKQTQSDNFFD